MTSRIMIRREIPQVPSDTPSSQGNFDTAACGDAFAARMRNMTAPLGSMCHHWDSDRSNAPTTFPEVVDRPE
jgi:hypothetical protein